MSELNSHSESRVSNHISCELQKELFGGGEAAQPDGVTSRKMSNGSTGSPKLKWLKAFKSLKTSSPTTPPLSDKWATLISFLANSNFSSRACREKYPTCVSDATEMVFHDSAKYIGKNVYRIPLYPIYFFRRRRNEKGFWLCFSIKSDVDRPRVRIFLSSKLFFSFFRVLF